MPPVRFPLKELLIWQYQLPHTSSAQLPQSAGVPNPTVVDDKIVASIFSPGMVVALKHRTGELCWETSLGRHAGSQVVWQDGVLLAKSSDTVFRLDPQTGSILGKSGTVDLSPQRILARATKFDF